MEERRPRRFKDCLLIRESAKSESDITYTESMSICRKDTSVTWVLSFAQPTTLGHSSSAHMVLRNSLHQCRHMNLRLTPRTGMNGEFLPLHIVASS